MVLLGLFGGPVQSGTTINTTIYSVNINGEPHTNR